jgi:hypothetical protein
MNDLREKRHEQALEPSRYLRLLPSMSGVEREVDYAITALR